jgi:hypothetical protein
MFKKAYLMKNELIFKTNSRFQSVSYNSEADSWFFEFDDNIVFFTQTIWRLMVDKKIKLVSLDHEQIFGLPKPLDLIVKVQEYLLNSNLLEIKVKQNTADLLLTLTNNLQIEIFISSIGYESYNFSIDKKNYIGMGSGDIAIYDI